MDRLAWFPCYASKLLGALPKLSPDERFVYLIALLRIYERNGPCPDEAEHFSRFTGLSVNRCAKALELLFNAGKLVMGPEGFTNPVADETLADMKAMHERQKLAGKYAANIRWDKRNRKSEENQGNVDATRMRSDAHLHLHRQSKKEGSNPPVGPPKGTPMPRKTRLPPEFEFSPAMSAYAAQEGFAGQQGFLLFERFCDHHRSKANAMADWMAAWRNWVRNEVKFSSNGRSNGHGRRKTVHEAADDLLAKIRSFDEPAGNLRDGAGENPVRLLSQR
jgi:hypothetical protein